MESINKDQDLIDLQDEDDKEEDQDGDGQEQDQDDGEEFKEADFKEVDKVD